MSLALSVMSQGCTNSASKGMTNKECIGNTKNFSYCPM